MKLEKFTSNALLLMILLFIAPIGFTQETEDETVPTRKEKIEQLKIAFITTELDLTTEEAEAFWPIYNEMNTKVREEKKARKKLAKDLRDNLETLSEEDIKTKTTSALDSDITIATLKKEYNEKIASIIGYKKATKLLSLEVRFKRELLKKLNGQNEDSIELRSHQRGTGRKGRANK